MGDAASPILPRINTVYRVSQRRVDLVDEAIQIYADVAACLRQRYVSGDSFPQDRITQMNKAPGCENFDQMRKLVEQFADVRTSGDFDRCTRYRYHGMR